jgi:PAS domain S-box-containing protein
MWDFNVFSAILFLGFVISSVYSYNLFKNRHVPGMTAFAMVFSSVAIWSLTTALEYSSIDENFKYSVSKLSYFGITFAPLFTLVFALGVSENQFYLRYKKLVLVVLLIPTLLTLFLALSNELHGLIWAKVEMMPTDYLKQALIYTYGPWIILFAIYSYLCLILSSILLLRYALGALKVVRIQLLFVVLGILTPLVANIFYTFKLNPVVGIDLTPIAFLAADIFVWMGLFQGKFFEVRMMLNESLRDNSFFGIIYLDKNLKILDKNSIAENYLAKPLKLGASIRDVLSPLEVDIDSLISTQDKVFEVEIGTRDNNKWLRIRSTKQVINANKEEGYVIVLEDITQLKTALKDISEKQELMNLIMDSMTDLIFGIDSSGKIIFWNRAMEKRFKRKEAEMIGKTIEDLAEIAFGNRTRPFLASIILGKDPKEIEPYYTNIKVTEDEISAEANTKIQDQDLNYWATAKKIFNSDGKMVGVLETAMVIDDIKRMQKEVSQTKSNLEAMIENTEDIITLLDRNLNLIAFNSAYVAWIRNKAGRDPIAGDNCNTLLKAEERDWWHERNLKALEGQKLTDLYVELNPDGSKYYLQVSFNPVRENDQITGITHFMSNVTRQKQLEEELQQKIIELETLNKKIME